MVTLALLAVRVFVQRLVLEPVEVLSAMLQQKGDTFLLSEDIFFRFGDMSRSLRIRWEQLVDPATPYHLARYQRFRQRPSIHSHDFAELFWVDVGSALHQVDGQPFRVAAGDVVFVRPTDTHGFRDPAADFTITNLAFPAGVLNEFRDRYYPGGGFPWDETPPRTVGLPRARFATVTNLGSRLALGPPSRLLLDRFLLELLQDLLPPVPTGASVPAWLSAAWSDWRGDPEAMRLGVRGLAESAGRSREHVSRVIRKTTGRRAVDLVNEARLDAAAADLRMTDQPIAQIAAEVGLGSLSHFYELFRGCFGTTPRRYRRSHRTVVEPNVADR